MIMKKLIIFFGIITIFIACNNNKTANNKQKDESEISNDSIGKEIAKNIFSSYCTSDRKLVR